MIVLDHPGKLAPTDAEEIAALVRRGKGLLYIAAEPIDAVNLALLARAADNDWKLPVTFAPPARDRTGLFIADFRPDAPGFSLLGDAARGAVAPLRFAGGLDTRHSEAGLHDDLLASYGDRSAAIVLSPCGAGSVAVLNADLSRSNLVASPLFVPLLGEIATRLLSHRSTDDARPCGQPLSVALPPMTSIDKLRVVAGDARPFEPGEIVEESGEAIWRWPRAGPAGSYRVMNGDRTIFALATAAPADESALGPIDPTLLETRLAGGRATQFQADQAGGTRSVDSSWTWIMLAVCVCMLGEIGVMKRLRA